MGSLYEDNAELLAALAILAPEGNIRVALVGVIDVLAESDDDLMWNKKAIFEIIARGIVRLNLALDGDEYPPDDNLEPEEVIKRFQAELGISEGE